jgi:hypothetical protein
MKPGWYLCSQLVRLTAVGDAAPGETALLEEIGPEGALVAAERDYEPGRKLALEAGLLTVTATVGGSQRRETDYQLELDFADGYRWDHREWRPEHLFRPAPKAKSAAGSK